MAYFETVKITGNQGGVLDGPAGSPSTDALTVQGISGGEPVPVIVAGGTLPALADANNVGVANDSTNPLLMDLQSNLRVRTRSESVLGDLVAMPRNNQVEVNFSQGFNPALVSNVLTGTGTATVSNGLAVFASGTTSGGQVLSQSTQQLNYRPGHEWYIYFTALFSTGGSGSSCQRIGPFSSTDGFYLSYEGSTVNFTLRKGSSDTHVAQSSWNGDPCSGQTGSQFTSGGVPVALDFQKGNIFRIHGAWFGFAPVMLEVFSPDGIWVTLHTFLFPNSLTSPFTATTNWPVAVQVLTAANANISLSSSCWAMGVVNSESQSEVFQPAAATWTSSTSLNAAVNLPSFVASSITVQFIQTGTFGAGIAAFEASQDGVNWLPVEAIDTTLQTLQATWTFLSGGVNNFFFIDLSGWAYFRIRLSQAITNNGSVLIQYGTSPSGASRQVVGTVTTVQPSGSLLHVDVDSLPSLPAGSNLIGEVEITDGTNVLGTSSHPVRVDPTGTTAQPVSGTLTVQQSSGSNLHVDVDSAPTVGVGLNATTQVVIGTSATIIIAANTSRAALLIVNTSTSVTVYIGASTITTSTGFPLLPGSAVVLPITSAFYGIVATGSLTVGVLEME